MMHLKLEVGFLLDQGTPGVHQLDLLREINLSQLLHKMVTQSQAEAEYLK
jgi:hypothetical protein